MKKTINKKNNNLFYITLVAIVFSLIVLILYIWFRPTFDQDGLPTRLVGYEFLSSQPESKLYYPGAIIQSPLVIPQKDKDSVAFIGAVLTSNDSPKKIYNWYHDWLTHHGWHEDENMVAGLAATQVSIKSYTRLNKREVFYVAMDDPKQLGWTLGRQIPKNVTIFEFRYIIR